MQALLDALAFVVLAGQWPVPLFWIFVHPFKRFWIQRGRIVYAGLVPTVWGAVLFALAASYRWLLAVRFEHRVVFWVAGAALLTIDTYLLWRVVRDMGWRVLIGLPELRPAQTAGRVIQEGIYAHVRHPRYLGMMLAYFGAACYTRALRVFVLAGVGCLLALLISELEERELLSRQGEEYARYRQRVPRFIPRWRSNEGGGGEELKRGET